MIIKTFTCGPLGTHCYLVGCPASNDAAVIDAPQGVTFKLLKHKEWKIKMIFITHSHWDHIVDAAKLKEAFHIPLYIHSADEENLKYPGADQLPLFFPIQPAEADGYLKEGEEFHIGELNLKVIESPGHSPGSVCLWFPQEKVLFSGDTLFQGSMGRIDFPTSSPPEMQKSLKKLSQLPPDTKVYPGHGLSTTLAAEAWLSH